jgi:feruloyl esterase
MDRDTLRLACSRPMSTASRGCLHILQLVLRLAVLCSLAGFACAAKAAPSCERLTALALPRTSITSAQLIQPGQFVPPQGFGPSALAAFQGLPGFCRVEATLKPTNDSEIKIEVWLPTTEWNGKLQSVGNGAWGGAINYPALAQAVVSGYASASTDTGHTGNNISFAPQHPEKVIDFGYRAIHEMTVAAKSIVAAFYSQSIARSYFNGCSTGGRQALAEAQRFPADYDGILAGSSDSLAMRVQGTQVWAGQQAHRDSDSYIPPAKYAAIHDAMLQACDGLDGVTDGVLEDPRKCHFDPKAIECNGPDDPSCLTAPQVEMARKMYSGPVGVAPGWEPGSELRWNVVAGPQPMSLAVETYQYLVFQNPNWDFRALDVQNDIAKANQTAGSILNADDPNLKPFFAHGGKLLMYHGWADEGIPPITSIDYYNSVVETMAVPSKAADSIRLFMLPGMGHCRGGEGPDTFDGIGALDRWVANGVAPGRIVASRIRNGAVDRTRPLCPYPQVAKYGGAGSTDDAANFVCAAP